MISTEQHEEALNIVRLYKDQERSKIKNMLPDIEKRLKDFFDNTYVEDFCLKLNYNNLSVEITSIDPEFDEDYNGHFDKDMEKISKELGIKIRFESSNYGK